jgi:hypothetical protein
MRPSVALDKKQKAVRDAASRLRAADSRVSARVSGSAPHGIDRETDDENRPGSEGIGLS